MWVSAPTIAIETVYLYRLNASADDTRRLLLIYLARINELADRPELYHLLTNSCTINIIRLLDAMDFGIADHRQRPRREQAARIRGRLVC